MTPVPMGHGTTLAVCADCRAAIKAGQLGISWVSRGMFRTEGAVQCYGRTVGKDGDWTC